MIVSGLLPILKEPFFRSRRIYLNRIGDLADCTGKGKGHIICTGEDDTLELKTLDTELLLIPVIPSSP